MTVNFTLFVILLLMIIFIIEKQKAYLNRIKKNTSDSTNNSTNTINQDREKNNKIDTLIRYQEILFILSFFLVVIGFTRYYNAKKIEYKSAFKLKNFFFSVNKCKSIKKLK